MKKNLYIIVTFIIFAGLLTGCGKKNSEVEKEKENAGVEINTNEEVIKNQVVEDFKLTNTSVIYTNGSSTLVTSVKNDSSETKYIKSFNIILKDDSGKIIAQLLGYIGEEIPAGETREITSSSDMDLTKATSVEYTINK